MNDDLRQTLLRILTIIDYQDDKEVYAKEFIEACAEQAILAMIQSLPDNQQRDVKQRMMWATDEKRQQEILRNYLTPDTYTQALQSTVQAVATDFIQTLLPGMSQEQQQRLNTYINSFTPQGSNILTTEIS